MKLTIDQSEKYEDIEILIRCSTMDQKLEKLIGHIRLYSVNIHGKKDKYTYKLDLEEILYFESVDEKTFIYMEEKEYESDLRIYELEEQLKETKFVRISKACILNTGKLARVRALLNGKYEVELQNEEKLIISRHYVPAFKKKFGL